MDEQGIRGIPAAQGTYLIGIMVAPGAWIDVGHLGRFFFPVGWYGYTGSAHGTGGLRARLARHGRSEKRLHWHVDYLLARGRLKAAWWTVSPLRLECAWADAIRRLPGSQVIVPGFGASDCRCQAHLAYLPEEPLTEAITRALTLVSPVSQCFWRSSADSEITVR